MAAVNAKSWLTLGSFRQFRKGMLAGSHGTSWRVSVRGAIRNHFCEAVKPVLTITSTNSSLGHYRAIAADTGG